MSYYDEDYDGDSDTYYFEFEHETADAILVMDGDRKIWLPKSQINYDQFGYDKGDEIEIEIPDWLAEENDLI